MRWAKPELLTQEKTFKKKPQPLQQMEVLQENCGIVRARTTLLDGVLNLPKQEKNHVSSCVTASSYFYECSHQETTNKKALTRGR